MTIYGNSARVQVDVSGGGIVGINVGTAQKLVIFGRGDPSSGTAQVNDPTQVSGPTDAENTFGEGTELADAIREASNNGVAYSMIWGVMPSTQSVTGESIAGGSGTLNNAPLIEDLAEISVQNTTDGQEADTEFRYDSPPTEPTSDNTVHINPFTGDVEAGDGDDYEIDYKYLDWQSAFDSATDVVKEQETGLWRVISEAESVVDDARATAKPLREEQWKMVRVNGAAQPNANSDETPPDAEVDPNAYGDDLDSDYLFVTGPERQQDSHRLVAGGVAGVLAGHELTNPVLGSEVQGYDALEQQLNVPQQEALESEGVIPLADTGTISLEANVSTSTAEDWTRDYFTRRVVDQVILIARAIGRSVRGNLNSEDTEERTEERIEDEILNLIEEGVLRPNTEDETRYFVNAEQDGPKELDISFGVTPVGVVDRVDQSITVNV